MPCSMSWCTDPEPHHHLAQPVGPMFPCDLPPYYRRKHGERAGWSADKVQRFVDTPMSDEFQGFADLDTDALLPMAEFWEWINDLRAGSMRRPFVLPKDHGQPAEPDGTDPECE